MKNQHSHRPSPRERAKDGTFHRLPGARLGKIKPGQVVLGRACSLRDALLRMRPGDVIVQFKKAS